MEEKREEDFNQEFDDDELDLTKDAFFSDLMDMEEEIASEAYELVEHAINLIQSQFYDDSIEILRQAIGLYTQINRIEEINAINDKISEVYLLKEEAFREIEAAPEEKVAVVDDLEALDEVQVTKESEVIEETKEEIELISKADQLIVVAHELSNNNQFEEALDKYDEAEKILEDLGKSDEIERLYALIEECYNKKAEYLQDLKKLEPEEFIELKESSKKVQEKEEKLTQFLEAKRREEEVSSKAYEILDQAVEYAKINEYDQAINLYSEGVRLFEELNWTYEANRIRDTIEILEQEKIKHFEGLEKERLEIKQKIETEIHKEKFIEEQVKEISEQEKLVQMERLRGIELQKMEQDFFKAQIDNMATEAARMGREYELAMQKAIKEGEIVEDCIYPKVIEIYKKIKNLLLDKGWNSEAAIYDDTINVYIQKFEQDQKIRQIEADKKKKQKEAEELLKVKEEAVEIEVDEKQKALMEEQRQRQLEIQNIRNQLEQRTKRAERLAREYEVALRQGKFELKCPYPEIINIFKEAKQIALERGWETDVTIFSSQIYTYNQKLEKDNRLRQIEVEKVKKQEEIEELFKVKEQPTVGLDAEKLKVLEEQKAIEQEKEELDSVLDVMINRAELMAREYESAMKKAIKDGKLAENPPFLKIIGIYERVKRMLLEKGRGEEAEVYTSQITHYSQKLEQDSKLREVEAKKAQRERALEEMHKIGQEIGLDKKRLKAIERKKEEEDFEKYISENVSNAEKMVRDYEIEKRKAFREGKILENTPYADVIEIYKAIREKVYARGWREQAEIFANQIKIYQEKLDKHEKLLEVEQQKAQREKALEDMHKVEKVVEVDQQKLSSLQLKSEEKEFEKYIIDTVNKAEKLEREFDSAMKKAIKKGEVLEKTPYSDIIEIYSDIKEKLVERGWIDQSQIYSNQIKIYQEKQDKHEKLLEVEQQKAQREKALEDMHKVEKVVEVDQQKLSSLQLKSEEKEFEKYIIDTVNKAEKLEREFDSAMKKAIKKGEVLEKTPYSDIIEIYSDIKEKLVERGWIDQSQIYSNQIKIYQEKQDKYEKLLEVEAKKAQRDKELEDLHKLGKRETIPVKPEIVKELEAGEKEEDILLDKAMNLIDDAEKAVKSYELSIRKDILVYESPYSKAISNYEQARDIFNKIGWKEEASRLINTIKFYKDKKEKDNILREIEQKKLEKPAIELMAAEFEPDKDFLERKQRLLEIEQKEKESDEIAAKIFNMIQNAERMAQEYELKIKGGVFDYEAPYEKIIEIYRDARKQFEDLGWKEESTKLKNTINFYKEKSTKDKRIRALEAEKVRKREEELLTQQRLLEKARIEEEKLIQQRKESLDLKRKRVAQFESQKDKAFRLMDQAKRELRQNHFDKAIEYYKESEVIFEQINWQEGIKMVLDSVAMITNKKKAFELEKQSLEQKEIEKQLIEQKLEEKLAEAEILKRQQQEEKRKEFLKIQHAKEQERKVSEEGYTLLEEGTALMDKGKFTEAYEKFIAARDLFQQISWHREVSRINNDLLFKLKREQKQAEALDEIKKKKIEEEKEIERLKEEAKREREEEARRRKEEKRRFAQEEVLRKISAKLDKAGKLIEDFRYNEGVLMMIDEIKRLSKLGKEEEIAKINAQVEEVKTEADIPIIILDASEEDLQNKKFKAAYKALDDAQVAMSESQTKKAISELIEANFQLSKLKLVTNYNNEINKIITNLREELGIRPEEAKARISYEDESARLRARIAARREERRKKVLELLKKRE
ncbi:MAG: hypothetical protein ACFE9S_05445 [Candidatus Hermodarchaeota archaeon]